mmetsp:Transcript_130723/g.378205  ORF Transcript_130723/g.378205 Transcript_130723/m.378205 type:complete len:307 (+) Transcript_130723:56-976(+)
MSAVVARSSAPKSPPRGAYGAFILDRRVDLRNMMAVGMRKKSFFKVAAEAWRRLSSSGKEAYRRRAVEMRAEYEQQRAAATTGRTRDTEAFASLEPKASRQKPTAEEERPQRKKLLGVRGGYGVFCAERRQALKEEFKGKSGKHLIRRIAAEWRKQTAAQREAYAARYRDAKAKLEEHMATRRSWRQEASEDTIERPSTAPARAPAAAVHDDHPARPPCTAFRMFCRENREEVRRSMPWGSGFSDVSRELARQWRAIPFYTKLAYQFEHQKIVAKYRAKVSRSADACADLAEDVPPPIKRARLSEA